MTEHGVKQRVISAEELRQSSEQGNFILPVVEVTNSPTSPFTVPRATSDRNAGLSNPTDSWTVGPLGASLEVEPRNPEISYNRVERPLESFSVSSMQTIQNMTRVSMHASIGKKLGSPRVASKRAGCG